MDTSATHEVKDLQLAAQGEQNIAWAESQMEALLTVKERFAREKPLKGMRVGMALHVTKETAVLVRTLIAGGAEVAITGCNPLSTQDDVAAALAKSGVHVWAYKGETVADYYRYLTNVIAFKPHITIDDGCDLISEIHAKHPELLKTLVGGCEETTTGVNRLRAMEAAGALKYAVIAVNDNKTKHLFDNYYGTGQSTFDGILRATNLLLAGKTVVVAGYGSCGRGVALRAKGLGSDVIVTEVDPFRALQARMDGYRVMPMEEAAALGDVFVTVTGNKHVLRSEHVERMKSGAVLANSGHFDVEIDLKGIKGIAARSQRIRPFLDEYVLRDGRKVYVAGEGRLVNLAAAEGHPSTVMAMSFCGQALAVEHIAKHRLPAGVHTLPDSIDRHIAELQLSAMGLRIDALTGEQAAYAASWQEGT